MSVTIKLRRGTATQWTSANPVLALGEVGLETDTRQFKVGDGVTSWSALEYWDEGEVSYLDLTNVPSAFPPDTHGHSESDITGLVTDLAGKAASGHDHTGTYEPANANIQTHVVSAHAPAGAQVNADITKAEIEAKLTGAISSHSHAGGANTFSINVQALTSSPSDGATVYFGMLPKAPTTTANISKVYVRAACTIVRAEIYVYSGTAGTNESWSLYIRKNNTTDTLIATVAANTNERVFSNAALNISMVAGDYFEIKGVQPTWATNPLTTIYGGYILVQE